MLISRGVTQASTTGSTESSPAYKTAAFTEARPEILDGADGGWDGYEQVSYI